MNITELREEIATLEDENDKILESKEPTKEQLETVKKNNEIIDQYELEVELKERANKRQTKPADDGVKPVVFEKQAASKEEIHLHKAYKREGGVAKQIIDVYDQKGSEGAVGEMQAEGKRAADALGKPYSEGAVLIPGGSNAGFRFGNYKNTRDLTIATEGADVEFDEFGGVIPILRATPVMTALGAQTISGLTGDLRFPRHSTAATMAWEGETDAGAETTPAFNNVTLTPKRLGGYTQVSGKFLRQSVFSAQQWVANELQTALTLALDTASISGATGGDNPVGLAYISNVNDPSRTSATNGKALTWAEVINMRRDVANSDAADGGYLSNPSVTAKLMTTARVASTDSVFIQNERGMLAGFPYAESTQVPSTLTAGTASGTASAIFYGQFSQAMFGQWGAIELLVDPYSSAKSGLLDIVINGYFDFNVRQPAAFARYLDVLTA